MSRTVTETARTANSEPEAAEALDLLVNITLIIRPRKYPIKRACGRFADAFHAVDPP